MWRETTYKQIEQQLDTQVLNTTTGAKLLKWIDIFNSQYMLIDDYEQTQFGGNYTNKNTELPFPFPNIFIEFANTEYHSVGTGNLTQKGICKLRIHIGQEYYSDSYLNNSNPAHLQANKLTRFQLLDKVFIALQGFTGTYFSALNRNKETVDQHHSNVIYDVFEYDMQIIDCSAKHAANNNAPTPITNAILHTNPDYDNTNTNTHIQTAQINQIIQQNPPPPPPQTNYIIP